jgi:hypothetical protein
MEVSDISHIPAALFTWWLPVGIKVVIKRKIHPIRKWNLFYPSQARSLNILCDFVGNYNYLFNIVAVFVRRAVPFHCLAQSHTSRDCDKFIPNSPALRTDA